MGQGKYRMVNQWAQNYREAEVGSADVPVQVTVTDNRMPHLQILDKWVLKVFTIEKRQILRR